MHRKCCTCYSWKNSRVVLEDGSGRVVSKQCKLTGVTVRAADVCDAWREGYGFH